MEISLAILAVAFALLGLVGAFLPIVPGAPLSLLALFMARWSGYGTLSHTTLLIFTLVTLFLFLADYYAPVWMTTRFGGSKRAVRGSVAGMVAGLFFPPFGMLIGPFAGAFLGELIEKRRITHAFKIAFLSFVSFLFTTGMKLIFGAYSLYCVLKTVL